MVVAGKPWIVRAVTGSAGVNVGGGGGKGDSCVLGKVKIQQVQGRVSAAPMRSFPGIAWRLMSDMK
jgi:hypothetical protein